MTRERGMGSSWGGLLVIASIFGLVGCDGILDVDTEGVIRPQDLEAAGPAGVPTLVNGMVGSYNSAADNIARYGALLTDEMILAQIDAALAVNPEEKILAFCCNWCSYAGADFAGVSRMQYPPSVRIIRTMCAGRVHPKFILHAFARGAGQVLVSGCHPPGDCHYVSGNLRAQARMEKLWPKLAKKGIDPARLRLEWISATEGRTFQRVIQVMAEEINVGEKG